MRGVVGLHVAVISYHVSEYHSRSYTRDFVLRDSGKYFRSRPEKEVFDFYRNGYLRSTVFESKVYIYIIKQTMN